MPADSKPTFERLGAACLHFRLKHSYIADSRFLFIPPKRHEFCPLCFQRRHQAQFPAAPELVSIPPTALAMARQIDETGTRSDSEWTACALENGRRQNFRLFAFEDCPRCQPRNTPMTHEEAEAHYRAQLAEQPRQVGIEHLAQRVFSFGFAHRAMLMDKTRLDHPRLSGLMGENHHARILYRVVTPDGRLMDATATGFDADADQARLKALMEFAERYAFNLHLAPLRASRAESELIERFMKLYRRPLSAAEAKQAQAEAVWGFDLLEDRPRAVPLPFLFAYQTFCDVKPTSSGYGAHGSFRAAVFSGILEILERDAFVRFWHAPERARRLALPAQSRQTLVSLASAVAETTGTPALVPRAFLIPSPLRVPVVLLTLSSDRQDLGPSLLFGCGSGATLDEAIDSALSELRLSAMNLVRALSIMPDLLKRRPPPRATDIPRRMQLYASPVPRAHLAFLDKAEETRPDAVAGDVEGLDALLERFRDTGIDILAIDCTPASLADIGVRVVRAFSTGLYPLQFEREDTLAPPRGKDYVGDRLSHFFL